MKKDHLKFIELRTKKVLRSLASHGLIFFFIINLTACIPFIRREPLPDERLRVTLEAFRLYQSNYVDEINNKDLIQGAISGMVKSLGSSKEALPPEILQYVKHMTDSEIQGEPFQTISDAFVIIQSQLTEENDPKLISYGAIQGMQETIDHYGSFLTLDEANELKVENTGIFAAIGLELTLTNEVLTIVRPIEGTPAERAGLQPGDQILAIDGITTEGKTLIEVFRKLRGETGTKMALTINRNGKPFELIISREKISIPKIKVQTFKGIGYIRVSKFHDKVSKELKTALSEVQDKGLKGLIIDLRSNPGGLLNEAISTSELFLDKGNLIAYTDGRLNAAKLRFAAKKQPFFPNLPVVVLVNKGTAAGSEILAAALQDWKRANILGATTFGRASIQTLYPLSDGSMLRLTTGRFFTPKDRTVQDKGVIPDIAMAEASQDEFENIRVRGDLKYDIQLQKAIEILCSSTN